RFRIDFDANGMKFTFVWVFAGDKGWIKINEDTTDLNEDDVAEAKEEMYAGRVERLVPLIRDKGFELSPLGEIRIEEHPAIGIRVSHKGHRDINLFFDKQTGLLRKEERTVKDRMLGGRERTQETLYSEYKDLGGIQHPTKVFIKRDGEKHVES